MALDRLVVATCQLSVVPEIRRNARRIIRQLSRAAAAGAHLAHFPEGALSGYAANQFEAWEGFDWAALEASEAAIAEACRTHGIWAAFGSAHPAGRGRNPFNALAVVDDAGGVVGRYHKRRCSQRDLNSYTPGQKPFVFEIRGLRVGCMICLDWGFPLLWQAHADDVELVLLSAYGAGLGGPNIHSDVVPGLIQGYAFLHNYRISVANACNRYQAFPSFWVRRSGRIAARCRRHRPGHVMGRIRPDAKSDADHVKIRAFRHAAEDGSLYAPYLEARRP
ncbi:MAG: carbon-nitrogen hydrolase family protein [Methyloligellaceae bacterium]